MHRPQLVSLEDRSTPALIGSLDATFANAGLAEIAFDLGGSKSDLGAAVATQPDGKIIVVGSAQSDATDIDFAVARLNLDGTLDATFGKNGIVAIGFDLGGENIDKATSVVVQRDGNIVVAGSAQSGAGNDFDFAVVRLTPAGQLDSNFDTDGRQTIAFDVVGSTKEDRAVGVALDSQGRIVLAGSVAQAASGDFDFGIVRLTSNGQLDTTLDADGRQEVSFDAGGANADTASGVVVDAQNRILVAGTVQVNAIGDFDFGIARLNANGVLDNSFDGDGRAVVEFDAGGTNADTAAAMALDSAGRVVVVGTVVADANGDRDVGVTRLNTNGTLDTTLNSTGKLVLGFDLGGSKQDRGTGVFLDPKFGDILISATVDTSTAGDTDIGIARLRENGSLDSSFDTDGRAVIAFDRGSGNADSSSGVIQDARGRILAVGSIDTAAANDRDIGLARLVGNTGLPQQLLVGGTKNGTATVLAAGSNGFSSSGNASSASPFTLVRPVVADLNGDGLEDQILGAGPGGPPRVRILLGVDTTIQPVALSAPIDFNAFEASFTGGVFLAAADVDGDGRDEFTVSPDVGGGPRATVYSLTPENKLQTRADFFGLDDPNFRGGARVAMGDINRDGRAELVVGAGFLGGPRVAIFDGRTLFSTSGQPPKLVGDFFAFPGTDAVTLRNGIFVAIGDVNGDGFADLLFGGGPGGGPRVFTLSGELVSSGQINAAYASPLANFFVANDGASRGGVRLAVKDIDGDERVDVITGSGDQLPSRIRVYRGSNFVQVNGVEPPLLQELDPFGQVVTNGIFVG